MFFGEIALLGGTTRTATVTSEAHTRVLRFPKDALEAAAKQAPSLADTLAAYARRRLLNNVMRTSEIFRRLSPEERERMLARFSLALFDAGQVIVRQGENSRAGIMSLIQPKATSNVAFGWNNKCEASHKSSTYIGNETIKP